MKRLLSFPPIRNIIVIVLSDRNGKSHQNKKGSGENDEVIDRRENQKYRRERGLTQEEVAAHLGISFQAISKWERNGGYPDITMLPALANYFHVSIDDLIGINELAKSDTYDEINRKWEENNRTGLNRENVTLIKESLKLFPNDVLLLVQLSASLEKLDGTREEKASHLKESIAVQKQILHYGEDSEIRGATLYNICFSYWKNGEHEKALEQARKLPNLYKARENALVYFLQGEEKRKVAKEALVPLAWAISLHLTALAETENNPAYYEKICGILDILFDGSENDVIQSIRENAKARSGKV